MDGIIDRPGRTLDVLFAEAMRRALEAQAKKPEDDPDNPRYTDWNSMGHVEQAGFVEQVEREWREQDAAIIAVAQDHLADEGKHWDNLPHADKVQLISDLGL